MQIPFVPAANFTPAKSRGIDVIVIHTMEAPESVNTAENVAKYFQRKSVRASAHYCIDSNSVVQCVRDRDVAWGAPGANHNGLHLEHAGYAKQGSAQWSDPYSTAMLKLSARLAARLCNAHRIPVRWLTPGLLKQGLRGFTSHHNVSLAFRKSTHTDPGPNFPHALYLKLVQTELSRLVQATPRPT
jgi:N-acetyl-anhydromuramyl-L-alanine amidase AmpD